jgi:Protein of unknown function (DUF1302)
MVRTQRRRGGRLAAIGCTAVLIWSATAQALYVDEDQNISLRARVYSQAAIRLRDSAAADNPPDRRDTNPSVRAGQLIQQRNFFNPELDAKLTPYLNFMRGTFLDWMVPDELTFRAAGWGFYDGIYDYGTSQFNPVQNAINKDFGSFSGGICFSPPAQDPPFPDAGKPCSTNSDCLSGSCAPSGAWFISGRKLRVPKGCPNPRNPNACLVDSIQDVFPHLEISDPYDIYALQRRINELYLSYSKGPLFVRMGRQAISWGESDTIALLDQTNPFDITLAAPGLFEDVDEARIPLWTLRASYNLFEDIGPFSSGFVEAYWVPGFIDTTTSITPILTASPYSPRGKNPQFSSGFPNDSYQFVLFDHLPEKKFDQSRWGFRFQTVVNRFFTVQAWIYTHFPQAPVPRHIAPVVVKPGSEGARTAQTICGDFAQEGCSPLFGVELVHDLTTVYGLAGTFFLEPLDSIVRINTQFFENEPGFIPQYNLNVKSQADRDKGIGNPGGPVSEPGTVPVADYVRWEIGLDRFFFLRPLNPTNSFVLVVSQVGSYNLDETSRKDFRFGGQRKRLKDVPGVAPVPDDFVQQKKVEAFFQATLQTDYLHGRLSPRFTFIQNVRGTYAIHPSLIYRWSDALLLSTELTHIGGEYQSFGFFQDKDQLAFRVTYQLN